MFGVNSSPYLAQYVSQHNAVLHADIYPMAAETILKSTYMDDSMDSTKNVTEGIELCRQLRELWQKADMHARKWISNSLEVLETIPEEDRAAEIDLGSGNLPTTKALGISLQAKHDEFIFKVGDEMTMPDEITKRNVLKTVCRIFDPLGFLAPYAVRGKQIMQDIWLSGVDWDENVREAEKLTFERWFGELKHLDKIKISRCLKNKNTETRLKSMSIHTFVDASSIAYGCSYIFEM